jgi:hypothetical protein
MGGGLPNERQQRPPGHATAMVHKPDHGENSYRGNGRLAGKATIVTGGDSGIGKAVAIRVRPRGAEVLIAYLGEHDDATSASPRSRCRYQGSAR